MATTPNLQSARLQNAVITINGTADMSRTMEDGHLVWFTSVTGVSSWVSVNDLFWY